MRVLMGVSKFFLLTGIFLLVKFISFCCESISVFTLSIIIESFLIYVLSGFYTFCFDNAKKPFSEKLVKTAEIAAGYFVVFLIFSILKNVINNYAISVITNFTLFGLMGALPLIRDSFLYEKTTKKDILLEKILILYFVAMKAILNVLHFYVTDKFHADTAFTPYLLIIVFVVGLYVTKSVVFNKLLSGYIEFDGTEYPVFDTFRVGKSKTCDIVLDEGGSKSTFFTVDVSKKGWAVKSSVDTYLENTLINRVALAESGDTIKCCNNYFTISTSKGNLFKRGLVFFFFIISTVCFAQNNAISDSDKLIIDNINFSNYPNIDFYFYDSEIQKQLMSGYTYTKKDFFLLEDGKTPVDFKDITLQYRPVDLALILDITGSMQDAYISLRSEIIQTLKSIKSSRQSLRVGLVTFADRESELTFTDLTTDYVSVINKLAQVESQFGGDYEENSLDALMKVRDFSFSDVAQKIIILVTDAPPHVRGDKGDKGRDFTNYTIDDIAKFFASSSCLLYIVSYDRFEMYHEIIKSDADFFDIGSYNSHGEIVTDLNNVINKQIKISYTAKKRKNFYTKNSNFSKNKIVAFKDLDAHRAKNFYNQKKIQKNSFLNSLFDSF